MELVPIIQYVLTIVGILTTVTLIFSYISFKIRQKTKPEQVYEKNQMQHMEPSFIGKNIRRITRITKEIIPLNPPVQAKKDNREQIIKIEKASLNYQKPLKDNKDTVKKNKSDINRRIEVMNNSPIQTNEAFKNSLPQEKNDNSVNFLGDDILDKYSDSEDQNLFTLKANKKDK